MESTWGKNIKMTIFGESHGGTIGVRVSGFPEGFRIDRNAVDETLKRRSTRKFGTSDRNEPDEVCYVSGITDDITDGSEFAATIENKDIDDSSYEAIKNTPRPGHADFTARCKYGEDIDLRGGGHFSGRLTAPLCIAGSIAEQILATRNISVNARIVSIGDGTMDKNSAIKDAQADHDSIGGIIECIINGVPVGTGEPLFYGMENAISEIMFGIPAVKAIEFGSGFAGTKKYGSQNNDEFFYDADGTVRTKTNNAGGILAGMANGMPIVFRVGIKPTPSIERLQKTVNLKTRENTTIKIKGRHDTCIALRAVTVVECAAALAVLDLMAESFSDRSETCEIRKSIDKTDRVLADSIRKRMCLSEEIGMLKSGKNIYDAKRENEILSRIPESARPVYLEILKESKQRQIGLAPGECIVLVGMPGCGKTSVGKKLSELTGLPWADTDEIVQDIFSCSIDEIFAKYGEKTFRNAESHALKEALKSNIIVSCGGGILLSENNRRIVKDHTVIYITREIESLDRTGRPLSSGSLEEMFDKRNPVFTECADISVQNISIDDCAKNIISVLLKK